MVKTFARCMLFIGLKMREGTDKSSLVAATAPAAVASCSSTMISLEPSSVASSAVPTPPGCTKSALGGRSRYPAYMKELFTKTLGGITNPTGIVANELKVYRDELVQTTRNMQTRFQNDLAKFERYVDDCNRCVLAAAPAAP